MRLLVAGAAGNRALHKSLGMFRAEEFRDFLHACEPAESNLKPEYHRFKGYKVFL
jgi:hypothetical protein